jgi:hypothetical protein
MSGSSYGSYSQGPSPYFAPPSSRGMGLTSIYKPPRRGTGIACGILGCLAIVLVFGVGGIGSCYYYTKVHLPGKARKYLDATERAFRSVASVVEKMRIAPEKSGTGQAAFEEMEREAGEACELARQLVVKTGKARKGMPADGSIAEGLDKSLVEYYELAAELGGIYAAAATLRRKTLPVLKEMNDATAQLAAIEVKSIGDATKAFKLCREKEEDFKAHRLEIEKLESNKDTAESRQQVLKLLDGLGDFFRDMGDSFYVLKAGSRKSSADLVKKSQRISKGAQRKFNKVLEEYGGRSSESEAKLNGKLKGKIKDIVDKQKIVENYFKSLKSDYGL